MRRQWLAVFTTLIGAAMPTAPAAAQTSGWAPVLDAGTARVADGERVSCASFLVGRPQQIWLVGTGAPVKLQVWKGDHWTSMTVPIEPDTIRVWFRGQTCGMSEAPAAVFDHARTFIAITPTQIDESIEGNTVRVLIQENTRLVAAVLRLRPGVMRFEPGTPTTIAQLDSAERVAARLRAAQRNAPAVSARTQRAERRTTGTTAERGMTAWRLEVTGTPGLAVSGYHTISTPTGTSQERVEFTLPKTFTFTGSGFALNIGDGGVAGTIIVTVYENGTQVERKVGRGPHGGVVLMMTEDR